MPWRLQRPRLPHPCLALAQPELRTTARVSGPAARCCLLSVDRRRCGTVLGEHRRADRALLGDNEREVEVTCGLDAGADSCCGEAECCSDAHGIHPSSGRPDCLGQTEHEVGALNGLSCGTLQQIVLGCHHDHGPGAFVDVGRDQSTGSTRPPSGSVAGGRSRRRNAPRHRRPRAQQPSSPPLLLHGHGRSTWRGCRVASARDAA